MPDWFGGKVIADDLDIGTERGQSLHDGVRELPAGRLVAKDAGINMQEFHSSRPFIWSHDGAFDRGRWLARACIGAALTDGNLLRPRQARIVHPAEYVKLQFV